MNLRLLIAVGFALVATVAPSGPAAAQQVDVIRGRVTAGADNAPVENVRVTVTSVSGNVSRSVRTDKNGRYTITFPDGDGDYVVSFAGIGFGPRAFQVQRVADEDFLVADAKLTESAQTVDTVQILSRDRVTRNDNQPDIGGSDRALTTAGVPPDQLGNLAALAATLAGVTFLPSDDGDPNSYYSVLGLGGDQNSTTLNGLGSGATTIPADAAVTISLNTAPYDVSQGGFSGAQLTIRTRSGTNLLVRGMSANLDSPHLQWSDRTAQALGSEYSNLSLGGALSGPLSFNKAFYNFSYQVSRRANDLETLLNTSPRGLQAAGISPDSAQHLFSILQAKGVPLSPAHPNDSRIGDTGSILGAFDFNPPTSASGSAYNLSFNGSVNQQSPVSGTTTELPAHSGDRTNAQWGVQARHSAYFSFLLSETTLGAGGSWTGGKPYLDLPSGRVRVSSDSTSGRGGVQNLVFGGSPSLNSTQTSTNVGAFNTLSWFSGNNRHRLKLSTEVRYDLDRQDQSSNLLGSFQFNSLGDLETGTPSSFTRQLFYPLRTTRQLTSGISLGDVWRPSDNVQVQGGVRLDGNRFLNRPAYNSSVETTFGVRNDNVPNRVYPSPRLGFSWRYGKAPQIGAFVGAAAAPAAVIRGGVGVFQNSASAGTVGGPLDNTGLPSAVRQINCVGSATPTPDWAAYLLDPATIPSQCADSTSGTVFSSGAPNIALLAPNYVAPRSVRSNLQWAGRVLGNRLSLQADLTYSLNLHQTSTVDLNFDPTVRFTIDDEGHRPVYVAASDIVPATGAITSRGARLSSSFARVTESRSDLRSRSSQLTLNVLPVLTNVSGFRWSLAYVLSDVREQTRGFSSTAGNPLDIEWADSPLTTRHQIVYNLTSNAWGFVTFNWTGSFRSGRTFTPMIAGDANGDGYSNDRAFVFDPATAADSGVVAGMQSLLANGSAEAKRCLTRQLGQVAARNSCRGPWTSTAVLGITLDPVKFRMPHRARLNLTLSNPLGAADLLLHGSDHLRGWGQAANLDQSLLYVRGFDAGTQRYHYDVNQLFGSTTAALGGFRTPVTLTMTIRFDMGPMRENQTLEQQLNRGRTTPDVPKTTEATFRAMYGSSAITSPFPAILRAADTLKLTVPQADSLTVLALRYATKVDSLWLPVAKYLADLPADYDRGEAIARYQEARTATIDELLRLAPTVKGLLTPAQRRMLPPTALASLDRKYLEQIRHGTGSYLPPLSTSSASGR